MVATRNHPTGLPGSPEPTSSPSKRTTRNSTAAATSSPTSPTTNTSKDLVSTPARNTRSAARARANTWTHNAPPAAIIWLVASLPLIFWDTGFILARPHSFPGGALAWLWPGYDIQWEMDLTYGYEAWATHVGWTLAQGWGNVLESAGYIVYLVLVLGYGGKKDEDGEEKEEEQGVLAKVRGVVEGRSVEGRVGAVAVLIGFATALATFWKTVLYWLNEAFSGPNGFAGIGHNAFFPKLFFLWVIPNGAWIVFPAYLMYLFGSEIVQGLEMAGGVKQKHN